MKRLVAFSLVVLMAALAAFLFVRHENPPRVPLATLLPAETIFLAQLSDLERARDDFRRTDLYALWHEPAIQDFLAKPKTNVPIAVAEANADFARLRARDLFVAASAADPWRALGGLEFRCSARDAREVIERWETRCFPEVKRSSEDRGARHYEVLTTNGFSLATIFSGNHFYFASDAGELEALLDRSAKQAHGPVLADDQRYRQVMREWPRDFVFSFYFDPQVFVKKIAATHLANSGAPALPNQTMMEKISAIGYALSFDREKMREVAFAAMPKLFETNLAQAMLPVASANTVLYLSAMVDLSQFGSPPGHMSPWQKFAPFTSDDLGAALGEEFSLLCEWPAASRMPSLLVTLPVRDRDRAQKIAAALADPLRWPKTARDQTVYYRAPMSSLFAAVEPTVAISAQRLVLATDAGTADRALALTPAKNPLAATSAFRETTREIAEPQQSFIFLDLPTFYRRLDALVRPILQMSAAFAPGVSKQIDPSKFPPADLVAKHLGPSAASQVYVRGGYRGEAVGSATFGQLAGAAIISTVGARLLPHTLPSSPSQPIQPPVPLTSPFPMPSPVASP